MRPIALLLLTFLVSGCAIYTMATPFDPAEHQRYLKPGKASISGQAFFRTRGGSVVTGAGSPVFLVPATSYYREALNAEARSQGIKNLDPRLEKYVRRTVGDVQGNFEFTDLPAGAYIAKTVVTWELPNGVSLIPIIEGGLLMQEVSVKEGEHKKVILTQ